MTKKREFFTYDLKDGRKIVYRGKTNDLDRRTDEHKEEGKKFTHARQTSRRMTDEGAQKKEEQLLEDYRKRHAGRNPKYNKKKK